MVLVLSTLPACELPDLSGKTGETDETAQLEEALDGDWAADPMVLDDPDAALDAVASTTLLETWTHLDEQMLDLAEDIEEVEGASSCVDYSEDRATGVTSATGSCDSEVDGADLRGSITVTSTATGGYTSVWIDLEGRDEGLRVDGDGVVSWDPEEQLLSLSVSRGWTAAGGGGASGYIELEAEGSIGQSGHIFAGQLVNEEHTELPAGALRFAVTSYPESGSTGRIVIHTLIQGDRTIELIRYDDDGAEGCRILREDDVEIENTCGT